MSKQCEILTSD